MFLKYSLILVKPQRITHPSPSLCIFMQIFFCCSLAIFFSFKCRHETANWDAKKYAHVFRRKEILFYIKIWANSSIRLRRLLLMILCHVFRCLFRCLASSRWALSTTICFLPFSWLLLYNCSSMGIVSVDGMMLYLCLFWINLCAAPGQCVESFFNCILKTVACIFLYWCPTWCFLI